jgi:hypothetical protein
MNKKIIILLTVLIDVLGIGIIVPVLPFYVESFGASDFTVTLLFAVFSFFSFFSAPLLGSLSDKIGRRPVLIASIASTAFGWLVFEQVRNARPSKLFLYQDGPRSEHDLPGIKACREVTDQIDWDCEVHRMYQEKNYGCDPSEYISQKWAFSMVDKCIVLEDDDVPSVSFFTFCKEMLDKYEQDPRITMIAGFNNEEITPGVPYDYFFASTFSIWGWASWKRVIDQWDEHYTFLEDKFNMQQLEQLVKERKFYFIPFHGEDAAVSFR